MTRSARSEYSRRASASSRAWTTVRDSNGKQRMVSDDSASASSSRIRSRYPDDIDASARKDGPQRLMSRTEWFSHARGDVVAVRTHRGA